MKTAPRKRQLPRNSVEAIEQLSSKVIQQDGGKRGDRRAPLDAASDVAKLAASCELGRMVAIMYSRQNDLEPWLKQLGAVAKVGPPPSSSGIPRQPIPGRGEFFPYDARLEKAAEFVRLAQAVSSEFQEISCLWERIGRLVEAQEQLEHFLEQEPQFARALKKIKTPRRAIAAFALVATDRRVHPDQIEKIVQAMGLRHRESGVLDTMGAGPNEAPKGRLGEEFTADEDVYLCRTNSWKYAMKEVDPKLSSVVEALFAIAKKHAASSPGSKGSSEPRVNSPPKV